MTRIFEKSSWGIVYRKKDSNIEVLLLKRITAKWKSIYVIPKWHIEDEEKAKETALREISEETWLPIEYLDIIKFITKINFTFVSAYKEWWPTINKDVYLFLVKYTWDAEPNIVFTDPKEKKEKFVGYKWFKIEELKNLNIKPDIYYFIKKNIQYM